ncbi:MAG: metallophosphoesterase, partial [Gammaproteobacteria bacterium]|nr:metallophosphoesterase [Gammaproteobacteria bacterium]
MNDVWVIGLNQPAAKKIVDKYYSEGGTSGWLGLPVSNDYFNPSGYLQCDFEGGYITTTDGVNYDVFEYEDQEPPTLVIKTPKYGEDAESYRIEVSGSASDESGIYTIMVNKNPIVNYNKPIWNTDVEFWEPSVKYWKTNVELQKGENKIIVTAIDKYHNSVTKAITVYYNPDFSFVHITDLHIGELSGDAAWAATHLHDIIYELNNYGATSKFILATGDLVLYNREVWFNELIDSMRSLHMEKRYVPGNHDRRSEPSGLKPQSLNNYQLFFPNHVDKIEFEEGGFQFIGLDSGVDYNVSWGGIWHLLTFDHTPESRGLFQEQIDFLYEQDDKPKIIFMHNPAIGRKNDARIIESENPVPSNNDFGGNDGCIAFNRDEFVDYSKENNVQLVLTGHTHEDAILSDHGTPLRYDIASFPEIVNSYPLFIQTAAAKDGYYRVIDIKNGIALPGATSKAESHPNWKAILACPANLNAYNSQSEHTGLNALGEVELRIPDSFYLGRYNYSDPNYSEIISLYNMSDDYRFEIVANLTEEEKNSPEIESFNFTVEQEREDMRTTI